jgi:hypothetical protein
MHWKEISWDEYPKPYSEELPRAMERAYARLSPEGADLLDLVVNVAATSTGDAPAGSLSKVQEHFTEEEMVKRLSALPDWDFQAVVAINKRLMEATQARVDKHEGETALLKQALGIVTRARRFDPTLPKDATIGQAIAVLSDHGQPLGISDEALEEVEQMYRGHLERGDL